MKKTVSYTIAILLMVSSFATAQTAPSMANTEAAYKYLASGVDKMHKKDFTGAIGDFSEGIKLAGTKEPTLDVFYSNRGNAYSSINEYEKALADYSKAIELAPTNANRGTFYSNRGFTYFKMKDYVKAMADYSKAIALYPSNGIAYINRGDLYFEMKDAEKACADWKRADELGMPNAKDSLKIHCK
jgi:tetratricopeptide (TPR) repeat protein